MLSRTVLLRTAWPKELLRRTSYSPRTIASRSDAEGRKRPVAFAFDIDGVLLQGSSVVSGARRALRILEGENAAGVKIPYVLITNGGGMSEKDRCAKLSDQLGLEIKFSQLIQAHTILREMAKRIPEDPVLVLGGHLDRVRNIALEYGFKQPYIPVDILAWRPDIWPLHKLTPEEKAIVQPTDFSKVPFSSILVFHDPRNWSLDIQIMLDILRSSTRCPGGAYHPMDEQRAISNNRDDAAPVKLVFCNTDLLWKSKFEAPRLGQGAFIESFQAVYKSLIGKAYPCTYYGKPLLATYDFAKTMLRARAAHLAGCHDVHDFEWKPHVYMVGDNPASDIEGANQAEWQSILVHTGVYEPGQGPPSSTPTHQARNVEEAVLWALRRENIPI